MLPVDLGKRIGAGKEAEVFDAGAHVLKLYRSRHSKVSAFYEAAVLAVVESLGLPVPSVLRVEQVAERWGIAMSKAAGASYADQMGDAPGRIAGLVDMAKLHRLIHSKSGQSLPSHKLKLAANIGLARELSVETRTRLLDGLAALPDGDRLCHGDFHPFNIMGNIGQGVIVDWLDACQGTSAADVCRSYVLMAGVDLPIAEEYLLAYYRNSDLDPSAIRAWLPCVAAARLQEGVPAETERLLSMAEAI